MRKAVRGAPVVVACTLFVLLAIPTAARASGPTLTLTGGSSGMIGSVATYAYSWDGADCSAAGVVAGDTVILEWENPQWSDPIDTTLVAIGGTGGDCTAILSGRVPGDSTTGDNHVSTAYLQQASLPIAGSEATASRAFFVTPTPTPRPTSKPALRSTPSPHAPASSSAAHHGAVRDPKSSQAASTASGTHPGDAGGPPQKRAVITSTAPTTGVSALLAAIPGGWFGLGVAAGVVLIAGVAATLVRMERRRFARMYPKEGRRGHR
ncbi:MAG: hypothetical protein WB807_10510 [Candidatus Dormiibacterota bacterium]